MPPESTLRTWYTYAAGNVVAATIWVAVSCAVVGFDGLIGANEPFTLADHSTRYADAPATEFQWSDTTVLEPLGVVACWVVARRFVGAGRLMLTVAELLLDVPH